jgi:hypothetical protein
MGEGERGWAVSIFGQALMRDRSSSSSSSSAARSHLAGGAQALAVHEDHINLLPISSCAYSASAADPDALGVALHCVANTEGARGAAQLVHEEGLARAVAPSHYDHS